MIYRHRVAHYNHAHIEVTIIFIPPQATYRLIHSEEEILLKADSTAELNSSPHRSGRLLVS